MFLEQKKIIMSWHLQVETKLGTYDHPDSGKFACTFTNKYGTAKCLSFLVGTIS